VTLSLISTNCNPILLYGVESLRLTKTDVGTLSHPYNSAYMKLFQSFNKQVITMCQFYCGELPLEQLIHIRTMNFYLKLNTFDFSPASLLFQWFGKQDYDAIAFKYNILPTDHCFQIKEKITNFFMDFAYTLINN